MESNILKFDGGLKVLQRRFVATVNADAGLFTENFDDLVQLFDVPVIEVEQRLVLIFYLLVRANDPEDTGRERCEIGRLQRPRCNQRASNNVPKAKRQTQRLPATASVSLRVRVRSYVWE